MRWRAMGIVEIKARSGTASSMARFISSAGGMFLNEFDGAQRGGSDREEKSRPVPETACRSAGLRPAKMRQSEASKGKGLFQRSRWQTKAAQEFSGRENIGMVAGDKFNHRHFAGLSIARPKCANAFQRRSERSHRACRKRHADIPAYGGLIPDFERRQERATTVAEKRGGRSNPGAFSTN